METPWSHSAKSDAEKRAGSVAGAVTLLNALLNAGDALGNQRQKGESFRAVGWRGVEVRSRLGRTPPGVDRKVEATGKRLKRSPQATVSECDSALLQGLGAANSLTVGG